MTTDADRPVEEILRATFTFDLSPDTRRSIDRRVEAAVASDRHYRPAGAPRRRLLKLTPRMLGGLAVATLLLATTAVAGGTLLSRLTDGAPLLENVWDRATDVGKSVTDAGYTVTLEKAAVDRDRVWVALVRHLRGRRRRHLGHASDRRKRDRAHWGHGCWNGRRAGRVGNAVRVQGPRRGHAGGSLRPRGHGPGGER